MPFYFFHLKLELYPTPAASSHQTKRASTSRNVYLPPSESDIFKTSFPAHRTIEWSPDTFHQGHAKRDSSGSTGDRSASRPPSVGRPESHGDALLLPERNVALRETHSPALFPAKPSSEAAAKDWRFDTVTIESIDMEGTATDENGRGRGKSLTQSKSSSAGLHTKGVYVPSEVKATDVGWGVVHLYRDTQETPELDPDTYIAGKNQTSVHGADDGHFDIEQCTTLCVLAVPSWMGPADFLGFVGDRTREDVSHFRMIRTGRTNRYMVLMKFKQAKRAKEWQRLWNGRLFDAMVPENCHVVFIKTVEFITPDSDVQDPSVFPQNNNDPFTSAAQQRAISPKDSTSRKPTFLSTKPLPPPTPSLVELPTCPVCLERMDETTGLLTILCQHVFHCVCLEKWKGSGCPVCRYTQSPSSTFPYPRPSHDSPDGEPACSVCASSTNLWICLICGNIGCGRYDSAHAYAHYEATSHCYAMDIATQHVWDYAGDGYVHRLIQNKEATSKLADLPARHPNTAFRAEGEDSVPREKMENMANEYTYLLTSQLEGQRRYFEEQVERAVDKASQAGAQASEAAARAEQAVAEITALRQENQVQTTALTRLEKELGKTTLRASKFEALARGLSAQLREEKTLNEGLLTRIQVADARAKESEGKVKYMENEKKELEEMNRDLTIFISSQEKVKELQAQGEEVVEGSVSVPDPPAKKGRGKGRRK